MGAESNSEILQEQITRVLLERLIVHRPHPWGLLITFIELIKNPRYEFWRKPFTRCSNDIQLVFESVAKSCMGSAGGNNSSHYGGTNEATASGGSEPNSSSNPGNINLPFD